MRAFETKTGLRLGEVEQHQHTRDTSSRSQIIPPKRVRYLSEIAENNRGYDEWVEAQCRIATKLYQVSGLESDLKDPSELAALKTRLETELHPAAKKLIEQWPSLVKKYKADFFEYKVRDKTIKQPLTALSLSGTKIPKVVFPRYKDWGDILRWQLQENIPGEFP